MASEGGSCSNKIPRNIRESANRYKFKEFVRSEILEKLPCNAIREEMMSGELRKRALRRLSHLANARNATQLKQQINAPDNVQISDFLTDLDFRDDFLKPDICRKKMKVTNYTKLKQLSKLVQLLTHVNV